MIIGGVDQQDKRMIMVNEVSVKGEEKAAYIHVAADVKRMRGDHS